MTLKDSTVSRNATNTPFGNGGFGGGIYNSGKLTLKDSRVSVSDNTSSGVGGGIANSSSGTVILRDSIVSGNAANGRGGGIDNFGTVILKDSTVSRNTPDNCYPPGSVAGCSG